MTDKKNTQQDSNTLAGVDISTTENGTILVVLATGAQVPLTGLDLETPAEDILNHLKRVAAGHKSLDNSRIDQDESDDEKGVRVITLKTNVQRKG